MDRDTKTKELLVLMDVVIKNNNKRIKTPVETHNRIEKLRKELRLKTKLETIGKGVELLYDVEY